MCTDYCIVFATTENIHPPPSAVYFMYLIHTLPPIHTHIRMCSIQVGRHIASHHVPHTFYLFSPQKNEILFWKANPHNIFISERHSSGNIEAQQIEAFIPLALG